MRSFSRLVLVFISFPHSLLAEEKKPSFITIRALSLYSTQTAQFKFKNNENEIKLQKKWFATKRKRNDYVLRYFDVAHCYVGTHRARIESCQKTMILLLLVVCQVAKCHTFESILMACLPSVLCTKHDERKTRNRII